MNSNPFHSDDVKAYVKPAIETIEIDLEGSILTGSGYGEDVNVEDTDF